MESLDKNNLKDLKNFFANRTKEMKDEKDQILSIIAPHLEKIDNSTLSEINKHKNIRELNQLGKFLSLLDENITIKEAIRESPDFIISRNKKSIGIELRDVYINTNAKKTEGTLENLFKKIEEELLETSPFIKGVYNITFKGDLSFKNNQEDIKNDVINCLKNNSTSSSYISNIDKTSLGELHLYSKEPYVLEPLTKQMVLEALAQKEEKLSTYKASTNSSECWLLLILDGFNESSHSSEIEDSILQDKFETGFSKVFIMDFFNSKITELKKA